MKDEQSPQINVAFEDKMVETSIDRIINIMQLPPTVQTSIKFQIIASTVEK